MKYSITIETDDETTYKLYNTKTGTRIMYCDCAMKSEKLYGSKERAKEIRDIIKNHVHEIEGWSVKEVDIIKHHTQKEAKKRIMDFLNYLNEFFEESNSGDKKIEIEKIAFEFPCTEIWTNIHLNRNLSEKEVDAVFDDLKLKKNRDYTITAEDKDSKKTTINFYTSIIKASNTAGFQTAEVKECYTTSEAERILEKSLMNNIMYEKFYKKKAKRDKKR